MKTGILLGSVVFAVLSFPAFGQVPSAYKQKKEISFEADVRPIFHDYCLNCHIPGGRGHNKSGLDLSSYESLMKGTKYGPVIKPGESFTSALVVGIEGRASPQLRMPWGMNGTLSKGNIDIIKKWVDQGAKNN